jgi:hypothetical protein
LICINYPFAGNILSFVGASNCPHQIKGELLLNSVEHAALSKVLEGWTLQPLETDGASQKGWVGGRDFFTSEPSEKKVLDHTPTPAPSLSKLPPLPVNKVVFFFFFVTPVSTGAPRQPSFPAGHVRSEG